MRRKINKKQNPKSHIFYDYELSVQVKKDYKK